MSLPTKIKLRLPEIKPGVEVHKTSSDGCTQSDTDHQVSTGCDSTASQLACDNTISLCSDHFSDNEWLYINQYVEVMVELGIVNEIDANTIAIGHTFDVMGERA